MSSTHEALNLFTVRYPYSYEYYNNTVVLSLNLPGDLFWSLSHLPNRFREEFKHPSGHRAPKALRHALRYTHRVESSSPSFPTSERKLEREEKNMHNQEFMLYDGNYLGGNRG